MKNGNHKWKEDVCVTCGCIREKSGYRDSITGVVRSWYTYERSGQNRGEVRPECLDWNDNTLD